MIARVPQVWRRAAFAVYGVALFVATHWPRLDLNVPGVERPDLLVHLVVFGVWAFLLFCSELFGPVRSGRSVLRVWLVAAVYAAFDEALQIPAFVGRHAAWDDLAANIGGVTLGSLAALGWRTFDRVRHSPD